MSTEFELTEAEKAFVIHFSYETFCNPSDCPAIDWLDSHKIHWNVLAGFQRWQVMNVLDLMDKLGHPEKLPLIQLPWETPADLFKRVEDSLVEYPDLRPLMQGMLKEKV